MTSTTISIDKTKLAQTGQKLTQLAASVQAYKLNAPLGRCEGAAAEELMRLGDSLQSFAAAFAELLNQCGAAFQSSYNKVQEMEAATSALFEQEG